MTVVVGLGNPGSGYMTTRHNVGFMILDRMRERISEPHHVETKTWTSCEGTLAGSPLVLLKPKTYMNLSSIAVSDFLARTAHSRTGMLVVCDDVWLPFGRIRIRPKGGDGGHNGLRSIIERLNSEDFARLRVGIGPGPDDGDLADFVLESFSEEELSRLAGVIDRAADGIEVIILQGLEEAMNRYNVPELT